MTVTGRQIAAARTLVGLQQSDLAQRSSISVATLKRMEASPGEALGLVNNIRAVQQALEATGVLFIPEDSYGPGVRLLRTAAFEEALASLIYTHECDADLSRVEAIVKGFPDEDRGALSLAFGDHVWGRENLPTDERGREIQDRLTRTGAFRA